MEQIDVAVIGAGVAGLASALEIANSGFSVCVMERADRAGRGASTRNSGVIHAGLYYPPGSLKARLCVEGRELLYEFCERHHVPHDRPGKLVLAHDTGEVPALEALAATARANGVAVDLVDAAFVRDREPNAAAVAALWSSSTGIIEPEAYIRALVDLLRDADVPLLLGSQVIAGESRDGHIELTTSLEKIAANVVVNAAGLYADEVSKALGGESYCIFPCRGEYAELAPASRSLVRGLLYPVPHAAGHTLGVHLTRTTWGTVLLGPTARYQAGRDDYESDRLPLEAFLEPARKLMPRLTMADLQPGGTGIRAKLCPPHEAFADFLIKRDEQLPSLIQVAGIDSPGLTSSLAIGKFVAQLVREVRS